MNVLDILDTAQYVVDKDGKQTAVLLDLKNWEILRQLLEEVEEDKQLAQLITAVASDEKFTGEAAQNIYRNYLANP